MAVVLMSGIYEPVRTKILRCHPWQEIFFFSSRRRHTSCLSDWSSDVCSSDLRIDPISRSAKPFCQGEAGAVGLSRMPAQSAPDDAAIDPVAIADEVVRSLIPRKRLRYLTCNPFCRRICCDVDPDQISAVEPDNDEGIEQVETDSWNNEQVHGGDVRRVVTQEGPPSLAGRPPLFDHVLGDARLRDLNPELEQFAVDARRAPKRFLMLICRISARRSVSICGRPPRGRDFQRQ